MDFGAIIIGDELLSGKRQDKHLQALIRLLAARGLRLSWVEYQGDDPVRIEAALRRAFDSGNVVFSFGGIGATPDDHTRQSAAAATGRALAIHPEARAIIEQRFGAEAYPHRIRMGEFPAGSRLIPNPVNQIAGFSVGSVHFVPGFPSMAWPMVEWVLDNEYREHFNPTPAIEKSVIVLKAREGDLIGLMQDFVERYPELRFSSLPCFGSERIADMHIEFGISGRSELVDIAIAEFVHVLKARGYSLHP